MSRTPMRGAAVLCAALCMLGSTRASAQGPNEPRIAPELRADLILGHQPAAQLGGGVQLPVGYYVRLGLVAAAGARLDDLSSRADARADLLVRFLLDPFRQSPYGLSVGGGISGRAEPGDRVRPVLLVAVDVEGRRSGNGLVPAMQVGLGGGLRIGVVVRRAASAGTR